MLTSGRSVFEGFWRNDEGVCPLAHDRGGASKAPKNDRGDGIFNISNIFMFKLSFDIRLESV